MSKTNQTQFHKSKNRQNTTLHSGHTNHRANFKLRRIVQSTLIFLACLLSPLVVFARQPVFAANSPTTEPILTADTPETFYTGCDPGFYIKPGQNQCVQITVCKIGYFYDAATNSCYKITCPLNYKLSSTDGLCHLLTCDLGYIRSVAGNCVSPPSNKFTPCSEDMAYDSGSRSCRELVPSDFIACDDNSYYNRSASKCYPIVNLEAYDSWPATSLIASNDSTTVTHGTLTETGLPFLGLTTSTSGSAEGLADITAPEYAELREIIIEYFEEQAAIEAAEEAANTSNTDDTINSPNQATSTTGSASPSSNGSNNSGNTGSSNAANGSTSSATKTCPEGKVINPATGRCRTLVTVSETTTSITTTVFDPETGETTATKTCKDSYTLNSETNRCVKNSSVTSTAPKTCPVGQYLNPATNRCKNLSSTTTSSTSTTTTTYDPVTGETTTIKTCIDGYELNPDTNRCVKTKNNNGADEPLDVPALGVIETSPKVFIAISVVVVLVIFGVFFAIFQLRHDIVRFARKIFRH